MSASAPPPQGRVPAATRPRSHVLLVAAALLVVVVVALVLVFGVTRPPALSTVSERPDPRPPGGVAWTSWQRDEQCLQVARPDGAREELRCSRDGGEVVGWDERGIIVTTWGAAGERELLLDPASGEVLEREVAEGGEREARPGAPYGPGVVFTERDGEELVVLDEQDREVWRVEAGDAYTVTGSSRSPGGEWLALTDSAGRLLLVPADGSLEPRVWAHDVGSARVVWEGSGRG